jgi:hypothetical protein
MKITAIHLNQLVVLLTAVQLELEKSLPEFQKHYIENKIGKDHKKRFLFDLLYCINPIDRKKWINDVYIYANDEHIYSALKHAYAQLTKL